jgi:phosphoenolpyruvate carboxykinase (GTP)
VPLVYEAFSWQHGVFVASGMGTETTSAATHMVGMLRRDPMAMLPFCGYNMADYFHHWLDTGHRVQSPPRLFFVNWFRTDDMTGDFIWPGFGQNIRVLKWILDRVHNRVGAKETPIGLVPHLRDLELAGLPIPEAQLERLFRIHCEAWLGEVAEIGQLYEQLGSRVPQELVGELAELTRRLEIS